MMCHALSTTAQTPPVSIQINYWNKTNIWNHFRFEKKCKQQAAKDGGGGGERKESHHPLLTASLHLPLL
jgi:hypothetical protein